MKIIKVGNGINDYPGNFTAKEEDIIMAAIYNTEGIAFTLHLFSGRSLIGDVKVDFSCYEADHQCDVFDFLEDTNSNVYDVVIIDAPYNQKFADKYQKIGNTPKQFVIFANTKDTTKLFNEIRRIAPKRIILKSWNYYCIKDYKIIRSYLCYPGGYRKSTLLLIMDRI